MFDNASWIKRYAAMGIFIAQPDEVARGLKLEPTVRMQSYCRTISSTATRKPSVSITSGRKRPTRLRAMSYKRNECSTIASALSLNSSGISVCACLARDKMRCASSRTTISVAFR